MNGWKEKKLLQVLKRFQVNCFLSNYSMNERVTIHQDLPKISFKQLLSKCFKMVSIILAK